MTGRTTYRIEHGSGTIIDVISLNEDICGFETLVIEIEGHEVLNLTIESNRKVSVRVCPEPYGDYGEKQYIDLVEECADEENPIRQENNPEENDKPKTAKDWGDIALFFKRYTEDVRIELLEELKDADITPLVKGLLLESMERAHREAAELELEDRSWKYIENGDESYDEEEIE